MQMLPLQQGMSEKLPTIQDQLDYQEDAIINSLLMSQNISEELQCVLLHVQSHQVDPE